MPVFCYLLECADGSYYSGMCVSLNKEIIEINNRLVSFFKSRPDLVPVTVIFHEDHIPFREAYVKHKYLRFMNKHARDRLLRKNAWPASREFKKFLEKNK
jgi:predicted GIY-YIG superfamily endonuclease